jgi:hypothetical protein
MVWAGVVGMLFMVSSRLLTANAGEGIIKDDNSAAYPARPTQAPKPGLTSQAHA